jgi:FtsZ-interacting cell division protein YlmF
VTHDVSHFAQDDEQEQEQKQKQKQEQEQKQKQKQEQKQKQKQIPPLRCGMTNKRDRQMWRQRSNVVALRRPRLRGETWAHGIY